MDQTKQSARVDHDAGSFALKTMENGNRDNSIAKLFIEAQAELAENGVINKLSQEWKRKLDSEDEAAAEQAMLAACRAAGRQLIVNETQLPRADGSVARLAEVNADTRFVNCLGMALGESAEKLVDSGITKYRRIAFYVRAVSGEADLSGTVAALNESFDRIDFELLGNSSPEKKPGFFARLFSRRRR